MNILFKIKKNALIVIFIFLIILLFFFLYLQYQDKNQNTFIKLEKDADIINPKFIKEKINKDFLEVIAKKASFLSENSMFLEGNVEYSSNNFILKSDKVNFNKLNFDAKSNENTRFESKKISIASHGFEIKEKGNVVHFNGKNIVKIK